MAEMPQQYILPLTVASYDVGADNRLRLSAVLRYQQEAAEQQLALGGMGWSEQLAHGMTFVTSRWHGVFTRLPAMGEQVVLKTWHHARKGVRFIRHYVWTDAEGDTIAQGVMVFALVSTAEHRLLRGDEFAALGDIPACDEGVDCAAPTKLCLPELSPVRTFTVGWSDTDRNGHLNNTRYADLLCDALGEQMDSGVIADVQMHFAGETRREETVTLSAAMGETAFVQGVNPRGTAFSAEVRFYDV